MVSPGGRVSCGRSVISYSGAIRDTGFPEGEYDIGERTVTIKQGGARLPDSTLAGRLLTMEKASQNVLNATSSTFKNLDCYPDISEPE
jgi:N-acetylgalactosamine-6-phosphate deacetylase